MIRKLLPVVFVAMALGINAQTIYFENFSNNALPNWTISNNLPNSNVLWKWSTGTSAGQATGQLDYAGAASGCIIVDSDADGDNTGNTREFTTITSKAIDCSGSSTVVLSFYEYYAKYRTDTPVVFVSNDSINWTAVYNPSIGFVQDDATANPNLVEANITSTAANQSTVYIRFSWKGAYDYWWFIDDVRLFVPSSNDVALVNIENTLTNGCQLSNSEIVKIDVRNKGLDTIYTLPVSYSINGGTPVSETITFPNGLAFDAVFTYTFTNGADLNTAGTYAISAWAVLNADTLSFNDTITGFAISAAPSAIPYAMGFELPPVGTEEGALTWTSEDVNNDGFGWFLSNSAAYAGDIHYRYIYNSDDLNIGGNDWLFSPCLNLSSTSAYKISFWQQVGISQGQVFDEKLLLKAGADNTSAAMLEDIADLGTLSNSDYEERIIAYKPSASGTTYLGFKCYSDPDKFYLDVDDLNITVLNPPNAQFTAALNGNTAYVTDGSEELITSWAWTWGDGTSGTGENPGPHTYATTGPYEICLIVNNLAGADTFCQTVIISGIEDKQDKVSMTVFPNPTGKLINVMFSESLKSEASVELINIFGQTVYASTITEENVFTIDMSPFAYGIYSIKIMNGTAQSAERFIYNK